MWKDSGECTLLLGAAAKRIVMSQSERSKHGQVSPQRGPESRGMKLGGIWSSPLCEQSLKNRSLKHRERIVSDSCGDVCPVDEEDRGRAKTVTQDPTGSFGSFTGVNANNKALPGLGTQERGVRCTSC